MTPQFAPAKTASAPQGFKEVTVPSLDDWEKDWQEPVCDDSGVGFGAI